ncbi:MAG: 50S ribosomal protein L20 [Brevinemataceae bacterium]
MRVTTSKTTRARHKKVLNRAKGFKGTRSVRFNAAKETLLHALRYEFIHRRLRRRDIKKLWITRINAFVRAEGITYSRFMEGLKKASVAIDRKVLAWLCMNDALAMNAYVAIAKQKVGK